MKKRVLAVILMLAMVGCFAACNQNNSEESKDESKVSEASGDNSSTESSTESSEESYNMGDYIDQNIKNVESYKKMMSADKGDVIIISSKDYVSEYYKFENGEIGVVDKSTEKDNEYTYLKYTEGNKMYTVDIKEKLYAETDTSKDGSDNPTDKDNFFNDLINYMYYGITYMGVKDGVEIYDIPQDEKEEEAEDETVESTDASKAKDDSSVSDKSEGSKTESSAEESSKEPDDMKRYIKTTDTGIVMYDYLNGKKQSTIEITIRKITDADKKQFTIEGCKKYEESSTGDTSFNEEDLPDIPDLEASVESKDDTSKKSKAEASKESKESKKSKAEASKESKESKAEASKD